MTIQWFPGHMAKAQREMSEKLKVVDMVIELRDSRIVNASRNPMIDKLCQDKPRLIVLTKKDKADLQETELWLAQLNQKTLTIALDLNKDKVDQLITKACMELMKPKHDRLIRKGVNPRAIRAMVVGIPNVGKSTLINRLAKRKVTVTANRPGITRSMKLIIVNDHLQLIDTPDVLWPKFEDEMIGYYLAVTGAISDVVLPNEAVAVFALEKLITKYPQRLIDRYHIEIVDDPYQVMRNIAMQRGFLLNDDYDRKRTVDTIIKEIRDDHFGRITWEEYHE